MAIQRLPEPAVRAIGSCQALTESSSLVKELIDNALDANATLVAVEISANTLDVVQVKDNGHGIAPGDRGAMAVRYSTSKISDLQELESIGGRSLGFRGVALSAACQMAGRMVITTRTEGESVAEACWIDKNGDIENRVCASHPVGTTVCIIEFLKCIPVRRENALKNSAKTLTKIRRTLVAYAFARPSVRFSLKVLKSGKDNWLYAPRNGQLDLSLIIGKDAAGQCMRRSYPPPVPGDREVSGGDHRGAYSIEALIPRIDADTSKISGKGQFISIDSRPVSCSRGTLKRICSLYKNYIRSTSQESAASKLVDPFICMNIVCPLGSYDVNVEPAKDDVQFGDPGCILSVVEKFFQSVYGELNPWALEHQTPELNGKNKGGFYILPGRKGHQTETNEDTIARNHRSETTDSGNPGGIPAGGPKSITTPENRQALETLLPPLRTSPPNNAHVTIANHSEPRLGNPLETGSSDLAIISSAWKFTMYRDGGEDEEILGGGTDEVALTEALCSEENLRTSALNPWTIAKMNSPARGGQPPGYSSALDGPNTQLPTPKQSPQRNPLKSSNSREFSGQEGLDREMTYAAGPYSSPRSPRLTISSVSGLPPSTPHKFTAISKECGLTGAGRLDTWLQGPWRQPKPSAHGNSPQAIQTSDFPKVKGISSLQRPCRKPGSLALVYTLPLIGTLAGESHGTSGVIPGVSKHLCAGSSNEDRAWLQIDSAQSGIQRRSRTTGGRTPNTPLVSNGDGDIGKTGSIEPPRTAQPAFLSASELPDYRGQRLEIVKRDHKTSKVASTERELNDRDDTCRTLSPDSNEYQAAKATLASVGVTPSSLESGDAAKYLTHSAQPGPSGAAVLPPDQVGRAKARVLPLETAPAVFQVHNLSTIISTTVKSIERVERAIAPSDAYVASGKASYTFPSNPREMSEIKASLRKLTCGMCQDETGKIMI